MTWVFRRRTVLIVATDRLAHFGVSRQSGYTYTRVYAHYLMTASYGKLSDSCFWTGLTLLNGFLFLVNFLFCFGSCGRLSWLNCQLLSAR